MKKVKIVTHFGKAHRDDYLACCCVVFHEYTRGRLCSIERRLAGSSDLESCETWVIDTGGHYDQELRNFDHHQSDAQLDGVCALDLVLRFLLGPQTYASFRVVSPWLRLTAIHDTKGLNAAAAESGVGVKSYVSTRSPVEKVMLDLFSELPVVLPESTLMCIMRETGRALLTEANNVTTDIPESLLSAPAPFVHAGLRVWDIRGVTMESDVAALAWVNKLASGKSVDVVVSRNGAAAGVRLYRQAWATAKLDLSRASERPGVRFVHKNGFYAILSDELSDDDIMGLLAVSASKTVSLSISDLKGKATL